MSEPARRRATLEDLAELRDRGVAVELVDGEIVHKAVPKPEHGDAQVTLGALLYPFKRRGGPRGGPGSWWIMSEVEVFYPITEESFRHDLVGFRRDRFLSGRAGRRYASGPTGSRRSCRRRPHGTTSCRSSARCTRTMCGTTGS